MVNVARLNTLYDRYMKFVQQGLEPSEAVPKLLQDMQDLDEELQVQYLNVIQIRLDQKARRYKDEALRVRMIRQAIHNKN